MTRVMHIDSDRGTAMLVLDPTPQDRAQRIIARLHPVQLSAADFQDIVFGRLDLAAIINRGAIDDQAR